MQATTHRKELEEYLERVLKYDRAFKLFKLGALKTIHSNCRDPLRTPRELALLYQVLLEAESPSDLRKVIKISEKLSLAEKYPWLKPIINETEKMIQELEKLEDEELELGIKDLL